MPEPGHHEATPSTREVVFARQGWLPDVVRLDGTLHLELGAGADANHDPRTFRFPIAEAHLRAIRSDLTRHLLLWSAVLPLCDAAGTRGDLDEAAAVALLDPILLGHERDVRVLFARIPWDRRRLVAHGADVGKLEYGDLFGALRTASEASDWQRVRQDDADRDRARRGVELAPLDEAVLRYTGQYLHRATRPGRRPADVDPKLLSKVLAVVASAERASAELERSEAWRAGAADRTSKESWNQRRDRVASAVRRAHPRLAGDAVETVSFLMCSEAADRDRSTS